MTSTYNVLSEGSIRLLRLRPRKHATDLIQGSLETHQFDNVSVPSYVALSYAWGPAEPTFIMLLGNNMVRIRKNLYSALCQENRDEWLWIDALCIDQINTQERNQQVRRMGDIYKRAQRVLVWLGPALDEQLREVLKRFGGSDGATLKIPSIDDGGEQVAEDDRHLRHVCQKLRVFDGLEYWRRCWVVQEYVLATVLEVRYGDLHLDPDHLCNFYIECESNVGQLKRRPGVRIPTNDPFPSLHLQREARHTKDGKSTHRSTLLDILQRNYKRKCQEPRDSIYSLLSLADENERASIVVDYAMQERVLFEMVLINATGVSPESRLAGAARLSQALDLRSRESQIMSVRSGEKPCDRIRRENDSRCLNISVYVYANIIDTMEINHNDLYEDRTLPDRLKAFIRRTTQCEPWHAFKNWYAWGIKDFGSSEDRRGPEDKLEDLRRIQELGNSMLEDTYQISQALNSIENEHLQGNSSESSWKAHNEQRAPLSLAIYCSGVDYGMGLTRGTVSPGDRLMSFLRPRGSPYNTALLKSADGRFFTGAINTRPRNTERLDAYFPESSKLTIQLTPREVLQLVPREAGRGLIWRLRLRDDQEKVDEKSWIQQIPRLESLLEASRMSS